MSSQGCDEFAGALWAGEVEGELTFVRLDREPEREEPAAMAFGVPGRRNFRKRFA
jgi:hypothetical protein